MNKIATFFRESGPARFLALLGIALIVFGAVILNINLQNQDYLKADATVTSVEVFNVDPEDDKDTTYTVGLKYTVDGKEYAGSLDGVGKCAVGDKMTIYYNPADPSQITQTTSLILPAVMIAAGVAALAVGIVSGVRAIKRYNKMKQQEEEWSYGK